MDERKYIKCACEHCGGHIEFPEDAAGAEVPCPHCKWKTHLSAPPPSAVAVTAQAAAQKRFPFGALGLIVTLSILAGGAGLIYWQRTKGQRASAAPAPLSTISTQQLAMKRAEAPKGPAVSTNEFTIGGITLERARGGGIVYAVGVMKNDSDRQRFGVSINLDLFDTTGERVGTATDYASIVESRKDWYFKAIVLEKKAVTAKFSGIKEDR